MRRPSGTTIKFTKRFKEASPASLSFISRLVLILILSIPLSSTAEQMTGIDLTSEERAWLAQHPDIVLGAATGYPPMAIEIDDGTHIGMVVDLFEQINQRLNVRIRLQIEDSWADIQEKAQNRGIDGLAFGGRDPSREVLYNSTDVIMSTYFSVFARSRNEYRLKRFSDLKGMRVGYKRAARPTRSLLEKHPEIIKVPYESHEAMTQALLSKEVDVLVAWISFDHWRKEILQGTIDNILLIDEYPIEMVTHIRKDWPELIPILNKAIADLQIAELLRINNKWFGEWPQILKQQEGLHIALTDEEKAWLAENHTVRVTFSDHAPYFYLKDGKVVGISVDILSKISEITGIKFQHENKLHQWSDELKGIREHTGPDLLTAIRQTPERKKVILFTKSYIKSPRFIFTRDDAPFVSSIENLSGKKVASAKGHVIHDYLTANHPNIDLVTVNSVEDAMESVSSGEAFAFLGDMVSIPFLINQSGLKNLKAACPSGIPTQPLAMGIRNDWPELRDILDKAIMAIPADEKAAIINKWETVRVDYGIRSKDILKWGLVVFVSVLGLIWLFTTWNRALKKQVIERTTELSESELRFRSTFEQAAVGIAHVSTEGKFIRLNQKFCEIVGYTKDEMLNLSFQHITHPDDLEIDLEYVRQVLRGEKNNYSLEKRYCRKDGSLIWVNLTVSLLLDDSGEPKYFISVINDITQSKRVAERLRAIGSELIFAEERERQRIASDLHDGPAQSLALALLQIEEAAEPVAGTTSGIMLDSASQQVHQSLREIRSVLLDLSSPALQQMGLSAGLSDWLDENIRGKHGLRTMFRDECGDVLLTEEMRLLLFRNARELLTNVVKHSQAQSVSVSMACGGQTLQIVVEDDGIGFDTDSAGKHPDHSGGFGLYSIAIRMVDVGGSLKIVSAPGKGCKATLVAPLEPAGEGGSQ